MRGRFVAFALVLLMVPTVQACSRPVEPRVPYDLRYIQERGDVVETNLGNDLIAINKTTAQWQRIGTYPGDVKVIAPLQESTTSPDGRFILKAVRGYSCCMCNDSAFVYAYELREVANDTLAASWGNSSHLQGIVEAHDAGRIGIVDTVGGFVDWLDWSTVPVVHRVAFDAAGAGASRSAFSHFAIGNRLVVPAADGLVVVDLTSGTSVTLAWPTAARTTGGLVNPVLAKPAGSDGVLLVAASWMGRLVWGGGASWSDVGAYAGAQDAVWTGTGVLAVRDNEIVYFVGGTVVHRETFAAGETMRSHGGEADGGMWLILGKGGHSGQATRFLHVGPDGRIVAGASLHPGNGLLPLPPVAWLSVLLVAAAGALRRRHESGISR